MDFYMTQRWSKQQHHLMLVITKVKQAHCIHTEGLPGWQTQFEPSRIYL
jgi:hypothetical protein